MGRRERQILAACRHAATGASVDSWWVTMVELTDGHVSYVSARRAMSTLIEKGLVEEGHAWRTIPVGGGDGSVTITRERKLIAVRTPLTPEQREIEQAYLADIEERRAKVIHELVTLNDNERRIREGVPAVPGFGSRGRGGDAS